MRRYQILNAQAISKQRQETAEVTQHYAKTGEWLGWGEPSPFDIKLRQDVLARKENENEQQ